MNKRSGASHPSPNSKKVKYGHSVEDDDFLAFTIGCKATVPTEWIDLQQLEKIGFNAGLILPSVRVVMYYQLPVDVVMEYVFKFLTQSDIIRLGSVCREYQKIKNRALFSFATLTPQKESTILCIRQTVFDPDQFNSIPFPSLTLIRCTVTALCFQNLSMNESLIHLNLFDVSISDSDIMKLLLGKLSKLRTLSLCRSGISDSLLDTLVGVSMEELTSLDLSFNPIFEPIRIVHFLSNNNFPKLAHLHLLGISQNLNVSNLCAKRSIQLYWSAKDYKKGYDRSYQIISRELGSASPTLRLVANLFWKGTSTISKNQSKAVEWFKKAADSGDLMSEYILGDSCFYGKGTEVNYAKALSHFSQVLSAEQYSYLGQANQSVLKSRQEAILNSLLFLGYMYHSGIGVIQNLQTALQYYVRAADHGSETAKKKVELLTRK